MTEETMNPDEHLKENTRRMLRLFAFGTLKRGFWNHDRFCRGVLDIQEAVVRGCLYEMHSGIPVLQVPDEDILAHGTEDPLADVDTQALLSRQMTSYPEPTPKSATADDWHPVYWELFTFDDPETRLPTLDRLEGFHTGGRSLDRRVLVPAKTGGTVLLVWVYVTRSKLQGRLKELAGGVWP